MSEPTYRIETRHEPHKAYLPWKALAFRVADDEYLLVGQGDSTAAAIADARAQLRALATAQASQTIYLDENGDPVPQSLRVAP